MWQLGLVGTGFTLIARLVVPIGGRDYLGVIPVAGFYTLWVIAVDTQGQVTNITDFGFEVVPGFPYRFEVYPD